MFIAFLAYYEKMDKKYEYFLKILVSFLLCFYRIACLWESAEERSKNFLPEPDSSKTFWQLGCQVATLFPPLLHRPNLVHHHSGSYLGDTWKLFLSSQGKKIQKGSQYILLQQIQAEYCLNVPAGVCWICQYYFCLSWSIYCSLTFLQHQAFHLLCHLPQSKCHCQLHPHTLLLALLCKERVPWIIFWENMFLEQKWNQN